MFDEKQVDQI